MHNGQLTLFMSHANYLRDPSSLDFEVLEKINERSGFSTIKMICYHGNTLAEES